MYSIDHHKRLKPKKESTFGRAKKRLKRKVSKVKQSDLDYLEWAKQQDFECFSCGRKNGIELHHIKEASSDKKIHTEVIPLCGVECHRLGDKLSAHGTPKLFREVFPIELQRERAKEIHISFLKTIL